MLWKQSAPVAAEMPKPTRNDDGYTVVAPHEVSKYCAVTMVLSPP